MGLTIKDKQVLFEVAQIALLINATYLKRNKNEWWINCGDCENWANSFCENIVEKFPNVDSNVIWVDGESRYWDINHAVAEIEFNFGKFFFDSQNCEGRRRLGSMNVVRKMSEKEWLEKGRSIMMKRIDDLSPRSSTDRIKK